MRYFSLLVLFMFLFSCQNARNVEFDGEKAMAYLIQQCNIGYRYPGSTGHKVAKNYYIDFLQPLVDTLILQEFKQEVKRDSTVLPLTNIIAGFQIDKGNPLLVGAHWDTRPRAEFDRNPTLRDKPIIGANDGASGIAILMHLAEILKERELDRAIYLVFFDGEDWGYHDTTEYFCLGSKYFVKNLPVKNISEAIIVDMVGDKELELLIERNSYRSNKRLVKAIWDIAEKRGYSAFKNKLGAEIFDDHVPLIETAGIPSINLIDFAYPNKYINYWHTHQDTPDKCSAESLQQVGQVVLDYFFIKTPEKK